mgnify:FL=1
MKEHHPNSDLSFSSFFWLFMLGSILGYLLEGVWCILTKGHWEHHAATLWGPFCIIYGIAAVLLYIAALYIRRQRLLIQLGLLMGIGVLIEYAASFFQEFFFGSVSWDYSEHWFHLNGRVSLRMAFLWGLLGFVFLRVLFEPLTFLLQKLKGRGWRLLCACLTLWMSANLLLTSFAVLRWQRRLEGVPASTPLENYLDETYHDQIMIQRFPNMRFMAD